MSTTEKILNQHLEAYVKGDLDGLLADFHENSVVIHEDQISRGLNDIKLFFTNLFKVLPPDSDIQLQHCQIDGNIAYIVWTAETGKHSYKLGTDTFFIQDGKILWQTVATYSIPN